MTVMMPPKWSLDFMGLGQSGNQGLENRFRDEYFNTKGNRRSLISGSKYRGRNPQQRRRDRERYRKIGSRQHAANAYNAIRNARKLHAGLYKSNIFRLVDWRESEIRTENDWNRFLRDVENAGGMDAIKAKASERAWATMNSNPNFRKQKAIWSKYLKPEGSGKPAPGGGGGQGAGGGMPGGSGGGFGGGMPGGGGTGMPGGMPGGMRGGLPGGMEGGFGGGAQSGGGDWSHDSGARGNRRSDQYGNRRGDKGMFAPGGRARPGTTMSGAGGRRFPAGKDPHGGRGDGAGRGGYQSSGRSRYPSQRRGSNIDPYDMRNRRRAGGRGGQYWFRQGMPGTSGWIRNPNARRRVGGFRGFPGQGGRGLPRGGPYQSGNKGGGPNRGQYGTANNPGMPGSYRRAWPGFNRGDVPRNHGSRWGTGLAGGRKPGWKVDGKDQFNNRFNSFARSLSDRRRSASNPMGSTGSYMGYGGGHRAYTGAGMPKKRRIFGKGGGTRAGSWRGELNQRPTFGSGSRGGGSSRGGGGVRGFVNPYTIARRRGYKGSYADWMKTEDGQKYKRDTGAGIRY